MNLFNLMKIFSIKVKLKKKEVYIRSNVKLEGAIFEGKNKIGRNTEINDGYIGLGTYIGDDCYLRGCKIGRYCSIGSRVKVITGKHPLNYGLTHPILFNITGKKSPTSIGGAMNCPIVF